MRPGVMVTEPWLKEVVWGCDRLQRGYRKEAPFDRKVGESWEVSCIPGSVSRVRGRNEDLAAVVARHPSWFFGEESACTVFPLLIKLLATSEVLSLQVHPTDAQARRLEGDATCGKHEAWVVLEATDDAHLYAGLNPGVTVADLASALASGQPSAVTALLRRLQVGPGDVIDVAPGTLHAIGPGLVLVEVQQPSDVTYRVYDWGRKGLDGLPRTLHVDKALSVVDPNLRPVPVRSAGTLPGRGGAALLTNPRFRLERWCVSSPLSVPVTELLCVVCVKGEGEIRTRGHRPELLGPGTSCVVPRGVSILDLDGTGLELIVALPPP